MAVVNCELACFYVAQRSAHGSLLSRTFSLYNLFAPLASLLLNHHRITRTATTY